MVTKYIALEWPNIQAFMDNLNWKNFITRG